MLYYIIMVVAAFGCAGNFGITKVYQLKQGNGRKASIRFNCFVGLFSAVVFWGISGFRFEITPYSVVLAFLMALCSGGYTIIGFKIMSMGSMAVYTVFLMLGGMMVPYIYGIIFLGESVTATKIMAILFMVVAVVMQSVQESKEKISTEYLLLCITCFFLNGGVSVISKVHQVEQQHAVVSPENFVLLKSLISFLFWALLLFLIGKKTEEKKEVTFSVLVIILASSVVGGFSYLLQLIAASKLAATVQFPIMTGGTIVFSALLGWKLFGEKLRKNQVISIFVCLIATVLFVIENS